MAAMMTAGSSNDKATTTAKATTAVKAAIMAKATMMARQAATLVLRAGTAAVAATPTVDRAAKAKSMR